MDRKENIENIQALRGALQQPPLRFQSQFLHVARGRPADLAGKDPLKIARAHRDALPKAGTERSALRCSAIQTRQKSFNPVWLRARKCV
jgi:hypothetical protein